MLLEARYFQISRLEKWLEDKCYTNCVEVSTMVRSVETPQSYPPPITRSWSSEFVTQLVKKKTSKSHDWVCPDQIWRSHGENCRGNCAPPKEGVMDTFESTEWVEVGKKYAVNEGWCSDEG